MFDNEKDLKNLSKEELDDLFKGIIEIPDDDIITYDCLCGYYYAQINAK